MGLNVLPPQNLHEGADSYQYGLLFAGTLTHRKTTFVREKYATIPHYVSLKGKLNLGNIRNHNDVHLV